MPFVSGFLRVRRRRDRWGRPVDPDYGVDEGDIGGEEGDEAPDQGLPGGGWGGQRPIDPGFGNRPPRPDYPSQGLPGGPIRPIDPGSPDNSLPPGTIVPPLPPDLDLDFSGKAYLSVTLIYQGQRHHHHIIVNVPETKPPAGGVGGTPPARPTPGQR